MKWTNGGFMLAATLLALALATAISVMMWAMKMVAVVMAVGVVAAS